CASAGIPFSLRVVGKPSGDGRFEVLVDVLGLLVLGQTRGSELATEAGLLKAAPFGLRQVGVEVVDPDGAVAQALSDQLGLARILAPHGTGESVVGVVGYLDRLVDGGARPNGHNWTEGLTGDHGHAALDLVEDRRQVVEAVGQPALTVLAAAAHTCALGHALLDIGGDLLTVGRGDERAGLGVLIEGPAEADLLGTFDAPVDELFGDGFLDDESGTGRAHLAGVDEGGVER